MGTISNVAHNGEMWKEQVWVSTRRDPRVMVGVGGSTETTMKRVTKHNDKRSKNFLYYWNVIDNNINYTSLGLLAR